MSFRILRLWSACLAVMTLLFSVEGTLPYSRAFCEEAAPKTETTDDSITMSFDGASLKDVLLLFSQKTGMNFVASQEIEQTKITVYFENVSPKEALDAIMVTNNLSYTRNTGSSIYMVYPKRAETAELVTRVFRLKYARLSSSPLDVGGQQTVQDMKTMASSSTSSSSSESSSSSSSSKSSSASRGIDSVISSFLSAQGKMAFDNATNSLIITDTQDTLDRIQKMLVELDVPQLQVILEVHVMEIQKGLISDKGIEWGGTDGALLSYTGGSRTATAPFSGTNATEYGGDAQIVAPADFGEAASAASLPQQMTFGTLSASDFAATIHYITTDSKTKILARPRILTQSNEAAVIRLVTNTSIANQQVTATTSGASSTNTTNEAERSETGVTLRMTPQVNSDSSVTLFIEPSVTTVGLSQFFPDVPFLDPTTRVVRTMARVYDNQTLVIGGLIDSTDSSSKRKIPYLGDIPGIGKLFSYDANDNVDRELIVFITPHIVRGQNSLTQSAVTAPGKDILARKMMEEFSGNEADMELTAFESQQSKTDAVGKALAQRERALAQRAELKASDPSVEKQMSMALDAFSPQLLDDEITKALSFQSPGSRSKSG